MTTAFHCTAETREVSSWASFPLSSKSDIPLRKRLFPVLRFLKGETMNGPRIHRVSMPIADRRVQKTFEFLQEIQYRSVPAQVLARRIGLASATHSQLLEWSCERRPIGLAGG